MAVPEGSNVVLLAVVFIKNVAELCRRKDGLRSVCIHRMNEGYDRIKMQGATLALFVESGKEEYSRWSHHAQTISAKNLFTTSMLKLNPTPLRM